MKLPHRSLAYGFAKWWLKRPQLTYEPIVTVAVGVIIAALLFTKPKIEPIDYAIAALLVWGAVRAWINRGIREVFDEQERVIEEMRSSESGPES